MTKKEAREIDKFCKKVLKFCDDLDEIIDRMDFEPRVVPQGETRVLISKEHYA